MDNLYYYTLILTYILLFCAASCAILKYNIVSKKNEKWYIYYIIFIFFIELTSYLIPYFKTTSNAFLYPIYISGEFFLITGIFIKKLNLNRYYFLATGLIGLIFLTAGQIFSQYEYNNDYSKAISNLLMIIAIAYSLLQDIKNIKNKNSFQLIDKMYFLYFTVSIFIFIFQHQLLEFPVNYFSIFWITNNLMVCIIYALFIKTFLQLKK